jgi:hypothetical protein
VASRIHTSAGEMADTMRDAQWCTRACALTVGAEATRASAVVPDHLVPARVAEVVVVGVAAAATVVAEVGAAAGGTVVEVVAGTQAEAVVDPAAVVAAGVAATAEAEAEAEGAVVEAGAAGAEEVIADRL